MMMIKRIYKESAILLILSAALSAFVEWKKLPVSILIGGVLGLANLKGLVWGVEGLIGARQQVTAALVFFSLLRFFMLSVILIILFWLKLINVAGIFIGFTLVLILLLKEGLKSAKNDSINFTL